MHRDLATLFKLRLGFFVVLSAVLGWFMATETIDLPTFLTLTVGGYALTGASNGLNQIIERRIDGHMNRTSDRPLPAGRMTVAQALAWSVLAAAVGLVCLFSLNPLSGWLGVAAIVSYAFIYTPLKSKTSLCVFVGAFPGALPPMIGYVAATGDFGIEPGTLFAVQFMWQFPALLVHRVVVSRRLPPGGVQNDALQRRAVRTQRSTHLALHPVLHSRKHVALGAEPTHGGECCFRRGSGRRCGFLLLRVPPAHAVVHGRREALDVRQFPLPAACASDLRS